LVTETLQLFIVHSGFTVRVIFVVCFFSSVGCT